MAKDVADHTPVVAGTLRLERVPMLTAFVLSWKDHLPTLGLLLAAGVVVAALLTFSFARNEDTRLQLILAIVVLGLSAVVQMWTVIGLGLIFLPAFARGI